MSDLLDEVLAKILEFLASSGYSNLTLGNLVMMGVALLLIYLAVKKEYEPLLLLPIGFGALLANLPLSGISGPGGFLFYIHEYLLNTGIIPILIFIGIGAMTDFGPLISSPKSFILGAAAQIGIFLALFSAMALGFSTSEAGAIGIIGSADGPTTIYTASKLAPQLLGPVAVAAYSYMSLVPVIQPPVIRLLTTKKERSVRMPPILREVSKREKILFPVITTIVACLLVPTAAPLIGSLMAGNLLRESGVTDRLSKAAQNELINLSTILLGLGVGGTMEAGAFLNYSTLLIIALGAFAFATATAGGVLFGKLFYVITKGKYNPMIGAAGVSAVPMSARVVQRMASKEDPENFLLMHAMGPNVAGVIGSAIVAGIIISFA
ncbi:MAG: Oxaloacetate decarboxylase beta chain [Candidatus Methanosuratincola subterraneus]|uniref:Oxaloacetate decarboxylase beta chain n=1 Tax=Methanosuratincola subterraneus TaxID=2593994 RepID=A0A3S3S859_METS7|nr:MAG: Oxaloacetate decarboxylase beta chain [Candidatus Methanosuratincola subterraneus]